MARVTLSAIQPRHNSRSFTPAGTTVDDLVVRAFVRCADYWV